MIRRPTTPAARAAFERLCKGERTDADALVFADWLTEQGSSLGEYITLARTGHARPATQLWQRDRLVWLGRIGAFLEPHRGEFVGGLPEFAMIAPHTNPEVVRPHARATEWLLFRALRLDAGARDAEPWLPLVTSPALRRVNRLEGLTVPLLEALAAKRPRLRAVEVNTLGGLPLKVLDGFPALTELKIRGSRGAQLATDELLARKGLERVALANALPQADWAFLERTHTVPELALYEWISSADWERDQRREKGLKLRLLGAPTFKSIEITLGGKFERALPQQLLQLDALPLKALKTTIIPARPLTEDERALVRRTLGPRTLTLELG